MKEKTKWGKMEENQKKKKKNKKKESGGEETWRPCCDGTIDIHILFASIYLFHPAEMVEHLKLQQDPGDPVEIFDDPLGLWCGKNTRMLQWDRRQATG